MRNMDEIMLLEHYEATAEEKKSWAATMRRGNSILKTYHARAKEHVGSLYSRQAFRRDLFAAVKEQGVKGGVVIVRKQMLPKKSALTPKIVKIGVSEVDIGLILKVREIEFLVLSSFSKMITKTARKWSRCKHGTTLDFSDFHSIGTAAVLTAIYSFTKEGIELSTYFHWAIHRKILNEANANKPLSAWPQASKKLYGKFEKMRNKLGMEVSFDEVADLMKLSDEEKNDLHAMLTQVMPASQIKKDDQTFGQTESLDNLAKPTKEEPATFSLELREAIARTPMSDIEKEVLEAAQSQGRGWATELARKHVNPVTGRAYSRRAPRVILDRVLARIRCNLPSDAA